MLSICFASHVAAADLGLCRRRYPARCGLLSHAKVQKGLQIVQFARTCLFYHFFHTLSIGKDPTRPHPADLTDLQSRAATRLPGHGQREKINKRPAANATGLCGASDRNRTNDTGIFSPLLYRLSYGSIGDPDETRTHDLRRDRAAF